MAANLTAVMDDTDKVKELIEDCKAIGLKIEAPNVNTGAWRFEPVDPRTIRYGLGGIKGTGKGAIEAILAERSQAGPFTSLFDFCARVEKGVVNRRVVEALVRAGAFDAIDADRAKLFATVGRALEAAEKAAADAGQESLFGGPAAGSIADIEYVAARAWTERERLAAEKLALGYYFSGHLFTEYAAEARRLAPTRLADVRGGRDSVRLAGIIVSARTQNTKRGRMGVIVLDDGSAQLELTVYAELFDRRRAVLKEDTLVFITGRVREFDGRISVNADDVMDLAEARAKAQGALRIEVDSGADVKRLASLLQPYRVPANGHPGNGAAGCRVVVRYQNAVGCADLALSEEWRVRPDEALIAELKQQARVRAYAGFAYG
jgi:DNA polymerase III subunit alpha